MKLVKGVCMFKKFFSLTLLMFSTIVFSDEYKETNVNTDFKKMHGNLIKSEEFKNDYKVENAQSVDRQIASEKVENEQDRTPNSIQETKENVEEKKPAPWLFKTEQSNN